VTSNNKTPEHRTLEWDCEREDAGWPNGGKGELDRVWGDGVVGLRVEWSDSRVSTKLDYIGLSKRRRLDEGKMTSFK
jgi:hypothetical protein